ncbi:orange carotenoid protein N-terminal domain-containing protein [Lyngbya confervoides]|uniref:Orange carotenoid protein n=1 Tax=Lyngbya confervoides BDU141951 TaxID=1574623 RepID=A0ABD4T6Z1_9CYAN|nr:orange carotenoid protein N-terminal domain-containing protein [Lyngbya confervoides]MCM1984335.1 Orange carotenoid protein [Lyngbya confervoides BDU141951]
MYSSSTFNLSLDSSVQTPVEAALSAFQALSTNGKLGLLWDLYCNLGGAITPAATGAARVQFIQGLLDQVKRLSFEDQLRFMRDLADRANTPLTRAYGVFTNNNKLAFWYQLAELMEAGEVIPVPESYRLSRDASIVFSQISALDFNQQITVLRQAVVQMGYDPFA